MFATGAGGIKRFQIQPIGLLWHTLLDFTEDTPTLKSDVNMTPSIISFRATVVDSAISTQFQNKQNIMGCDDSRVHCNTVTTILP